MAALPDIVGPYRILRKIGEGGMGAVYEGVHELIERKVAIKILHAAYAAQPEFIARFFNEARAVNRVDHAGLVQISDYGQLPDNTAYIVMELLSGDSLATRIKKRGGGLGVEQSLNFGSQLADALAAAHEKNIVHRDLKPDNVIIIADSKAPGGERTKLLDFGIAKLAGASSSNVDPIKTSANALMGTPYYMSPEQCRGSGKVDGRSDVYSLGVMLYEMLSGVLPITGEGTGDIMVKHVTEEPMPLRQRAPELPEAVAALVHRMLIKDRDKRPVMQTVADESEALSNQYPPHSVRRSTTASMHAIVGPDASPLATGIGTAAGQTTAPSSRGRSIGVAVSVTIALLGFGALGVRALRQGHDAPPAIPAASPPKIHWHIDSTPPGAEVIQVTGGRVLGTTPWDYEGSVTQGTLQLKLRLGGYTEQVVELSQNADVAHKAILLPLAARAAEGAISASNSSEADADKSDEKAKAKKRKSGKVGTRLRHWVRKLED